MMKKNKFYSICSKIIKTTKLDSSLMKIRRYYFKKCIVKYYSNTKNVEIKEIVDVIKRKNQLNILNYNFYDKYEQMDVEIEYDIDAEMYYILPGGGNPLYLKKEINCNEALEYYRTICAEQDKQSPHRYLSNSNVTIKNGDVVLDLGGAEGNFVLENISKISKAIIVECDESWIKALKMTFQKFPQVIIVNKMIADKTIDNYITIDDLIEKYNMDRVNFIKMDIEGMEVEALQGCKTILNKGSSFAICTYHNNDDYKTIAEIFKKYHYKTSHSKGFMTPYTAYNFGKPYIRRGLIFAKRG